MKIRSRRNYAHFDTRVSMDDVWPYISNPTNIASHSFYPFIRYVRSYNKYNKSMGIKKKERELCYSAHIDRCIFQFYSYKLNQIYNKRVRNDKISNSAIAYRDDLKKNNIDFAKRAIDFIRKTGNCYIIVGDFTKFFDSLEHKYLKSMLNKLLGTTMLPADYYAVYKNITRYSIWDMKSLLSLNGLPCNESGVSELNKRQRVLTSLQFKQHKKLYIEHHKKPFGIPQGSPISAVLSNIYMLDFDKAVNDYVTSNQGLYMRYSDDIIVVLPEENVDTFKTHFSYLNGIMKEIPKLNLQPEKTQIYRFKDQCIINCNELVLANVKNGKNSFDYLGFTFDGKVVVLRDKTLSKYYYRLYRKLKTIIKSNGRTKYGNRISSRNLYEKYSVKGANIGKGNFISYVRKAEKIFGKQEAISRGTKNHMQKIRRKLNTIKWQ